MSAEEIIQKHLQESIKQLMSINDRLSSTGKDTDLLEQRRLLIAAKVYALALVQSEIKGETI